MDPLLGMISIFGCNFAPRGWALCQGQLLPLRQNTALFSLLGTQYGGDGKTTFALPDLRGRMPIGFGQGPGLSSYAVGEQVGAETTILLESNMPPHSHGITATSEAGDTNMPDAAYRASTGLIDKEYNTAPATQVIMNAAMVSTTGSSQPISLMQPYLTVNYCIALEGVFPQRP